MENNKSLIDDFSVIFPFETQLRILAGALVIASSFGVALPFLYPVFLFEFYIAILVGTSVKM